MATKETQKKCLVHPRTHVPEFHRNIEEIRRKNLEDNKAFLEGLLMTKVN